MFRRIPISAIVGLFGVALYLFLAIFAPLDRALSGVRGGRRGLAAALLAVPARHRQYRPRHPLAPDLGRADHHPRRRRRDAPRLRHRRRARLLRRHHARLARPAPVALHRSPDGDPDADLRAGRALGPADRPLHSDPRHGGARIRRASFASAAPWRSISR